METVKLFIQTHTLWFVFLFVLGSQIILLTLTAAVKEIVRVVIMEMVAVEYLEPKWARKKYQQRERLRQIALGNLYVPTAPPKSVKLD